MSRDKEWYGLNDIPCLNCHKEYYLVPGSSNAYCLECFPVMEEIRENSIKAANHAQNRARNDSNEKKVSKKRPLTDLSSARV